MKHAQDQLDYLTHVLARTGWTQSELAVRAGLDPSTLSRFLTSHQDGRALRASTLRKIGQVTGIPFGSAQPVATGATNATEGLAEAEAVPLQAEAQSHLKAIMDALSARGRAVDPWVLKGRALEGAGFRPGDTLLVALGETALAGDVVCAQVYDWQSGRAETLFRIFEPPYLIAASSDATVLRPLVVDGENVQIKGVVITSVRDRTGR